MIHPNPDVYRRAAFLVLRYRFGKQQRHPSDLPVWYSCEAIKAAAMDLGESSASRILHVAQYQNMFGPNPVKAFVPVVTRERTRTFIHPEPNKGDYGHPYWNRYDTQETQDLRALALLFMAELVANP